MNRNITLKSAKYVGGLFVVKYATETVDGEETFTENHEIESTKTPHPDFLNALQKLKTFMARVHGFTSLEQIRNTKVQKQEEKNAFKVLAKVLDRARDLALENLNMTGISLSGKSDMLQVIITGTNTTGSNKKVAINSERLSLAGTTYGFEEELEAVIGEIEEEVLSFLFDGKKAQPELFDNEEETKTG